jgi:excisionase family DNA binding protein
MRDELELPLLDVAAAADFFAVNRTTIHRWIRKGKLKAVFIGREPRFRRADIDRVLDDATRVEPRQDSQSSPQASAVGRS